MLFHTHEQIGVVVDDSKKTRRRILAFIVSRDGSVSSGQNDSFLRWMLELLRTGAYAHERVNDLRDTLEAMAEDGEIVLAYAESKSRKIIGARLPDDTDVNSVEVSQDDLDLFDRDALWRLVSSLRYQRDQAVQRADDVERAFNQLVTEDERGAENRQLVQQMADQEEKMHELATQAETHAQELAQARQETSARLARQETEWRQILANQGHAYERKLGKLRDRINTKSAELEACKKRLKLVEDLSNCSPALLVALEYAAEEFAERLKLQHTV